MGSEIQLSKNALDDKQKASKILKEFKQYLNNYIELEKEFTRISNWRFIKQFRNTRKKEKLTKSFKNKMFELGLFK